MKRQTNEKILNSEVTNIKDAMYNKVELNYNDSNENDYPFLNDDIEQILNQVMTHQENYNEEHLNKKGFQNTKAVTPLTQEEYKALELDNGYSLNNCQGDGVCFTNGTIPLKIVFKILGIEQAKKTKEVLKDEYEEFIEQHRFFLKHNDRYYHEKSFDVESDYFIHYINKELTKEQEETLGLELQEIQESLKNKLENICRLLETIGYEHKENEDINEILRQGLKNFLEQNGIDSEIELYDIAYTNETPTEKEKDYIQIATDGNTNIKGLWIKPFQIKTTQYERTYTEIEKTIVDEV